MTTNVPQIWFVAQRVLRTIVQVGIPAFLSFALVLPQIIEALGLPVTSSVYLALVIAAAVVTAIAAALARVMAIPAVNGWLTNIGLGSVPRHALTSGSVSNPASGQTVNNSVSYSFPPPPSDAFDPNPPPPTGM